MKVYVRSHIEFEKKLRNGIAGAILRPQLIGTLFSSVGGDGTSFDACCVQRSYCSYLLQICPYVLDQHVSGRP